MSRMSIGSLLNNAGASSTEKASSTSPPPASPNSVGRPADSDEIILAPHLRTRVPANPSAHPPPLSPLDALVHAATNEENKSAVDVEEGSSNGLYPNKRRRPSSSASDILHSTTTSSNRYQGTYSPPHHRIPTTTPSPPHSKSNNRNDATDEWFEEQVVARKPERVFSPTLASPVQAVKPEFSSPFRASSDRSQSSPFQPAMDVDPGLPSPPPTLLGPGLGLQEQLLDVDPERTSMPPPSLQSPVQPQAPIPSSATGRKKPGPKPKPKPPPGFNPDGTVKVRKKPGPKPKPRNPDGTIIRDPAEPALKAAVSQKGSKKSVPQTPAATASSSRSRSTSVLPNHVPSPVLPDLEPQNDPDDREPEPISDKLYCICQTPYDEDKVMIACDRCDEWYHTSCVNMSDLGVDLVDQFYCPPCVSKNPNLSLHTTYKQRCLFGTSHPTPASPEACHKAARGAFSKYCSEDCGVRHMRTTFDSWEADGGKRNDLWKSVRLADKPEGVVVRIANHHDAMHDDLHHHFEDVKEEGVLGVMRIVPDGEIIRPPAGHIEGEKERLEGVLDHVVKLRENVTKGMAVLLWREHLLELARNRAKRVGRCGWDQRLCFSDEEVVGFGEGVMETYDARHLQGTNGMDVDETNQWWCHEERCNRHDNWQSIRLKDIHNQKEQKEAALAKLTTRERKIRAHIEDITDYGPVNLKLPKSSAARTSLINGDAKKGSRKRKAPS